MIEYLEDTESFDAQRAYAKENSLGQSPEEMLDDWGEWVPRRPSDWRFEPPVFTRDEVDALEAYHEAWRSYEAARTNHPVSLDDLQITYEWVRLTELAATALSVLMDRGKFSDTCEERF